jgi:hypothetical protein
VSLRKNCSFVVTLQTLTDKYFFPSYVPFFVLVNPPTILIHLGILLLQPSKKGKQRALSRTVHGSLLSLALVSAVVGFWAIYDNKERLHKEHFHSNHALLGCTAVFVFALQVLFGLSVAYAPKALYRRIGQARITRIHRVAGYISISLVWGTLWLAVVTNWVKRNFNHEWVFYLGMGMVAVGLVGQITPSRLYLTRKRNSVAASTLEQ